MLEGDFIGDLRRWGEGSMMNSDGMKQSNIYNELFATPLPHPRARAIKVEPSIRLGMQVGKTINFHLVATHSALPSGPQPG